jgi:indolepyruvate ferredoxin oxidoreductase beta subunit
MKNSVRSILLAGVGGQGILRASDIISMALMAEGMDVKKSEVHGMAQRGGCVTSFVRYGEKVYSPLASKGTVDILLSFEQLETLRYLDFLKKGATIIMNEEQINPPAVNLGDVRYPQDVYKSVRKLFKKTKVIDATALATLAGNIRTANTVMIGVLSRYLDIKTETWEDVLKRIFPEKLVKENIKAFDLGRNA